MRRLAFLAAASLAFIAISEPISASQGQFKNESACWREGNCMGGCQACGDGSWDCTGAVEGSNVCNKKCSRHYNGPVREGDILCSRR